MTRMWCPQRPTDYRDIESHTQIPIAHTHRPKPVSDKAAETPSHFKHQAKKDMPKIGALLLTAGQE